MLGSCAACESHFGPLWDPLVLRPSSRPGKLEAHHGLLYCLRNSTGHLFMQQLILKSLGYPKFVSLTLQPWTTDTFGVIPTILVRSSLGLGLATKPVGGYPTGPCVQSGLVRAESLRSCLTQGEAF